MFSRETKAIYLRMETTNVTNAVTSDGEISACTEFFTGIKLNPNGWAGEIQDIFICPARANQAIEHLTGEEQFALRSELVQLIWIPRIARQGASYGASAARVIRGR